MSHIKKITGIILALCLMLSACSQEGKEDKKENKTETKTEKLSENISIEVNGDIEKTYEKTELKGDENQALTDFGLKLLKASLKNDSKDDTKPENVLVSPLSIFECLNMVENGAKENTLREMEETMGLEVNQGNKWFKGYNNFLEEDKEQKLFIANSIWFKNSKELKVEKTFLEKNAFYYNADIYKRAFDDGLKDEINQWVSEKTNKMINEILDKVPEDAVMYLINAISFVSDWEEQYEEDEVFDSEFTLEDGSEEEIELMYSEEYEYLENDNSTGIIKPYKNGKFAFVALLPNEDIKIKDYLESLSAEEIHSMIKNRSEEEVYTYIPKFQSDYGIELGKILQEMGMKDAFHVNNADFSELAILQNGNISISKVIHNTHIEVDERGTKAAASTMVEMEDEAIMEEETKTVRLDRPFVYMIYDMEMDIPIFMGYLLKVN